MPQLKFKYYCGSIHASTLFSFIPSSTRCVLKKKTAVTLKPFCNELRKTKTYILYSIISMPANQSKVNKVNQSGRKANLMWQPRENESKSIYSLLDVGLHLIGGTHIRNHREHELNIFENCVLHICLKRELFRQNVSRKWKVFLVFQQNDWFSVFFSQVRWPHG